MGQSERQIGDNLERQVLLRDGKGPLSRLDRFPVSAQHPELFGQIGLHPSVALRVADPICQLLSFAQTRCNSVAISERLQHIADVEADIDRLLNGLLALRQSSQRLEGLLEKNDSFRIGFRSAAFAPAWRRYVTAFS
jgi:hypothetical protein